MCLRIRALKSRHVEKAIHSTLAPVRAKTQGAGEGGQTQQRDLEVIAVTPHGCAATWMRSSFPHLRQGGGGAIKMVA